VVKWFKEHGLLEEVKPYRHSVGHSYRSHVPIEPYLSDQWYCKVTDDRLAGAALRAMARDADEGSAPTPSPGTPGEGRGEGLPPSSKGPRAPNKGTLTPALSRSTGRGSDGTGEWQGQLRFYPARYAKTFQTWHENIRDWCISRQLWWGHRIPVWHRKPPAVGAEPWTEEDAVRYGTEFGTIVGRLVTWQLADRLAQTHFVKRSETRQEGLHVFHTVEVSDSDPKGHYVCVRDPDDREVIEYLEANGYVQDPDVLDTWFSSGLWPMSTLNWPEDTPELRKWNPSNVLVTAREIITLWVSRMVMFNLYFRDRLPFTDVFIHAMIQDGEGQKMSKSLGNGVDPLDIISSHGADAMRYTLAAMTTQTQDLRMPVDLVDPHSGQAFSPVKITNSAGYVVAAPTQTSPKFPDRKLVSSYGVISGAAKPTADIPLAKNTSSKFDLGRNFANKIWNAARFALMNLASVPSGGSVRSASADASASMAKGSASAEADPTRNRPQDPAPEPVDEQKWSLADRWIVSRFNRTVE
jgi:valyl-tRNA synthetase